MRLAILNGNVLTPAERCTGQAIFIHEGIIRYIGLHPPMYDDAIDARGLWVVPGFIDVHVHGACGHDLMDATRDALYGMARFFARQGVTAYYPTTMSASAESIQRALDAVATAPTLIDGAQHLGVHLEGPYLNADFCGAQPAQHLRKPHPDEYNAWLDSGIIALVTLAPELPQASLLMQTLSRMGVRMALGHSGATYEQALNAFDEGISQCTHIYNAMRGFHHRQPGALGATLLDERVYAQIIPDGVHVHPAAIQLLLRLKGIERIIIITDATSAAGLSDGRYTLGATPIQVEAGIARTRDGALAGSALTMIQAIRNMLIFTGLPLSSVLSMATVTPAQAMGLARKGRIAIGYDADLAFLDSDLNVRLTMIGGRIVYDAR